MKSESEYRIGAIICCFTAMRPGFGWSNVPKTFFVLIFPRTVSVTMKAARSTVGLSERPHVVLTPQIAREIFKLQHIDECSSLHARSVRLSSKYGVTAKAIRDIWKGRSWLDATYELWDAKERPKKRIVGRPKGSRDSKPRARGKNPKLQSRIDIGDTNCARLDAKVNSLEGRTNESTYALRDTKSGACNFQSPTHTAPTPVTVGTNFTMHPTASKQPMLHELLTMHADLASSNSASLPLDVSLISGPSPGIVLPPLALLPSQASLLATQLLRFLLSAPRDNGDVQRPGGALLALAAMGGPLAPSLIAGGEYQGTPSTWEPPIRRYWNY